MLSKTLTSITGARGESSRLKINPPDLLMMKRWRNTILSMQAGDNFLREIVLLLQSSIILLCCCHYLSFKISYCILYSHYTTSVLPEYYGTWYYRTVPVPAAGMVLVPAAGSTTGIMVPAGTYHSEKSLGSIFLFDFFSSKVLTVCRNVPIADQNY